MYTQGRITQCAYCTRAQEEPTRRQNLEASSPLKTTNREAGCNVARDEENKAARE